MSNPHHILKPSMLTDEGWRVVEPLLEKIHSRTGGCICITLEVDPMSRNFAVPHVSVFDDAERKLIRKAILKKRERERVGAKAR